MRESPRVVKVSGQWRSALGIRSPSKRRDAYGAMFRSTWSLRLLSSRSLAFHSRPRRKTSYPVGRTRRLALESEEVDRPMECLWFGCFRAAFPEAAPRSDRRISTSLLSVPHRCAEAHVTVPVSVLDSLPLAARLPL